jgi:hypothetical protein
MYKQLLGIISVDFNETDQLIKWSDIGETYKYNGTVKVKLSLCFNWAPCHEGVLGEWMYNLFTDLKKAYDSWQKYCTTLSLNLVHLWN